MRIHLIAPPNTQTTRTYSLDGFTIACIRFATMMKSLGHTVILYGSEENEAPCDELVRVISKSEQKRLLGKWEYQYAAFQNVHELWDRATTRTIREIQKRQQPRDFICSLGGAAHKKIADAFPGLIFVEYSIGYVGCFSKYKVFQSEAWRHWQYGRAHDEKGHFFDAVIPYFFEPSEYPLVLEKEDYAVYVGRLTPLKGVIVACQACQLAGIPLKIIGHGDKSLVTHGAEYLGPVSDAERNEVVSKAKVLLAPTLYLEPFGAMVVEANLCGTPVVTTDFGAFIETVVPGVTGFRCNILGEFVQALEKVATLNPAVIQQSAVEKYSMRRVSPRFQAYFDRLNLLWDRGWESI